MRENVFLSHYVFALVFLYDIFFLQGLHGVHLVVQLGPDQQNLRIGALSDDGDQGEVFYAASYIHCLILLYGYDHNKRTIPIEFNLYVQSTGTQAFSEMLNLSFTLSIGFLPGSTRAL